MTALNGSARIGLVWPAGERFHVTPVSCLGWVWVRGEAGRVRTGAEGTGVLDTVHFDRLIRAHRPMRLRLGVPGQEVLFTLTVGPAD